MSKTVNVHCDICECDFTGTPYLVYGFKLTYPNPNQPYSQIVSISINTADKHICKACLKKFVDFAESVKVKEQT